MYHCAGQEKGKDAVTITVAYDENPYDPRLQTAWGFGCLVEIGEKTVLFDTGGDGVTLLRNVVTLETEPTSIDTIVLSHVHANHTGGLASFFPETGLVQCARHDP
jgi:7,8-dihydropterin-6-yl-methyl-4-(beta-D-ribofuranosyl)aminobenzene 5'-phosphate synthase